MKYQTLFILVIFVSILTFPTNAATLKEIRVIGDDETENYMFFQIRGAVMTPDKTIYILDSQGPYIAQYDWNGKFVKREGRKGNGPGDYLFPKSLQLYKDEFFVYDSSGWRIARLDLSLKTKDYYIVELIKVPGNKDILPSSAFTYTLLDENKFLGTFLRYEKKRGRLCIFDRKDHAGKFFYNYMPGNGKIKDIMCTSAYVWSRVIVGVNHKTKRILATSFLANNTIDLLMYDFAGKPVKQLTFKQNEKFRFPSKLINTPRTQKVDWKKGDCFAGVVMIQGFKNGFFVFVDQVTLLDNKLQNGHSSIKCLIFSEDGKLLEQFDTNRTFQPYFVSEDGYIIGKKVDQDFDQVVIFKIEQ